MCHSYSPFTKGIDLDSKSLVELLARNSRSVGAYLQAPLVGCDWFSGWFMSVVVGGRGVRRAAYFRRVY